MKKVGILALLMTTSTFAAGEFGGIKFHSTVTKTQTKILKNDLRYLYLNPTKTSDGSFQHMAELPVSDGPNMHHWLINRVRYILGENYVDSEQRNSLPGSFPATPLPDFSKKDKNDENRLFIIMANKGAADYYMGKMINLFLGHTINNEVVYVKSPRTGIIQVGEGLFHKGFLINPRNVYHPANSIFRLSVLFHEARHSDGNGKNLSYFHNKCPQGHYFEGQRVCEKAGNGPYAIGALAMKQLALNCTDCSKPELVVLSSMVSDNLGRVVSKQKKPVEEYKQMISIYTQILVDYEKQLKKSKNEKNNAYYRLEMNKLRDIIASTRHEMTSKSFELWPDFADPTPEGTWTPITLNESKKIMERSLKK